MTETNLDPNHARRNRRRVYGRDFKLQVVRRLARGLPASELAQDFGLSPIMMMKWLREWQKDPTHAFRGCGQRKPHHAQMERLRRQIKRLRVERNLLKKASAHFASNRNWSLGSLQSIER